MRHDQKKTLHANGQKRDDIVKKRADWRELQKTLEIDKLVFLDEDSINCAMTRLWGWGEKHARVEDYVPDARFERTSILATVRLSGVNAPITFKGTLNGEVFALYVKYVLAPTLSEGDVVFLDNLSSHKALGVFDPIGRVLNLSYKSVVVCITSKKELIHYGNNGDKMPSL